MPNLPRNTSEYDTDAPGRGSSRGSSTRQIAPTEPPMRRSAGPSKALLVTKFTTPPIASASMSGVGDLVTSTRSIESELTVVN